MPTVGHSVKFKFGTQQEFDAITSKDNDTLYFTTDTLILYQGSKRYSKRTKYGTSSPDGSVEGVEGDLYIQVGGEVATGVPFWYYNGTSWAELFHAQPNLGFTPPKTVNGVGDGGDVKTKVVVSISNSKVSSHSHVQILGYFNAGNEVIALYSGTYYPLSTVNPQLGAYFERSTVKNGQIVYRSIRIQGTAATIDETENPVDGALSDTSTNPVQNKVVKAELDNKVSKSGDTMSGDLSFGGTASIHELRILTLLNSGDSNGISFTCFQADAGDGKPAALLAGAVGNETVHLYGLASPVEGDEAVNKAYVDAKIPNATTSDNNKFLRIVNGTPAWVALTNVAEEGA